MPKTAYERTKEYIKNNKLKRVYAFIDEELKYQFELKLAKQKIRKVNKYSSINDFIKKHIIAFVYEKPKRKG